MKEEIFRDLYDDFQVLMKKHKLGLGEMTAACLSWFLTFVKETVPQENRIMLMQKIEKSVLGKD